MFCLSETDDVTYRINPEAETNEFIIDWFKLLGKIIGKAIFERIPLNTYLDRTLIKHILN
jgi:hypothetical protein